MLIGPQGGDHVGHQLQACMGYRGMGGAHHAIQHTNPHSGSQVVISVSSCTYFMVKYTGHGLQAVEAVHVHVHVVRLRCILLAAIPLQDNMGRQQSICMTSAAQHTSILLADGSGTCLAASTYDSSDRRACLCRACIS